MNILIVKLSAIGDVIHALPVSYVLRKKYPDAHITWVVEPTAYEILKHNPCVDEVIIFNKKAFKSWKGFKENYKPFKKMLNKRKYDISIDLQGLFKSAAVVFTANAKQKIGYVDMREGSNFISKCIRGNNQYGHIVDRYLDTVKFLGCDIENIQFPLENTTEEIDFVNNLLEKSGLKLIEKNIFEKYVAFAVGTNWVNKCWSTTHFAKLSQLLAEKQIKVILLGFGTKDEQKANEIMTLANTDNIINFVSKTNLLQTARIIKLASAVVGGDTGNLHLAAALNVPAIMLMGPTDPNRNGPYRQKENVILAGHECDGCWKRVCAKNIDCLSIIQPEQVMQKLEKIGLVKNNEREFFESTNTRTISN